MFLLIMPAILLALVLAWVLSLAFRGAESSSDPKVRLAAGVGKSFLIWLIVGATPFLLASLSGPGWSLFRFMSSFTLELPIAAIGTAILWFRVPAKKSALVIGLLMGGALAPLVMWTLALILPKNEATMGYAIFGFLMAVPNALAGAIAGHWRAQAGENFVETRPRPLPS